MSIKVNGAWKKVKQPWVHVNGSWKKVKKGWVHVNGTWREFFSPLLVSSLRVGHYTEGSNYERYGYRNGQYGGLSPDTIDGQQMLSFEVTRSSSRYGFRVAFRGIPGFKTLSVRFPAYNRTFTMAGSYSNNFTADTDVNFYNWVKARNNQTIQVEISHT